MIDHDEEDDLATARGIVWGTILGSIFWVALWLIYRGVVWLTAWLAQ